ncbi:MAG: nucleotidyl transferase AbiEii/AbiGii toxin family protein [Clostridia bacterium]|jgi:predicted nucleotidyltransferase component of viral defense system
MKLNNDIKSFNELISIVAADINIPPNAVKKDYFIVKLLQNLQNSSFAELIVFKGGTSLSKCYPGSIERFSEDIDLTFIPNDNNMSDKQYDKAIKRIETAIIGDAISQKIDSERSKRKKSTYVWLDETTKDEDKIKLEIGSTVEPYPFEKRMLKTYIQEYLESKNMSDIVQEFELEEVEINVLCIDRTFIDKLFAVKRHAIAGDLSHKVRHIYDVTRLFDMPEIKDFLADKQILKEIVKKTKDTDLYYLEKVSAANAYNPTEAYDFLSWKKYLDGTIKANYETLHHNLLFTNEKQEFSKALATFEKISNLLAEIKE